MKNIVVGIDFSNSAMVAMRHAVSLSIKTQADIHLVWVKSPGLTSSAEEFDESTSRYVDKHVSYKQINLCFLPYCHFCVFTTLTHSC